MPKGKKFNAAEEHFHNKETQYQKQLKQKCETIAHMNEIQTGLIHDKQELQANKEAREMNACEREDNKQ